MTNGKSDYYKLFIKWVDNDSIEDVLYFPTKEKAKEKEDDVLHYLDREKYYTEVVKSS